MRFAVVLLGVVLAVVLLLVPSIGTPITDIQIRITTDEEANVDIWVNGVNLDDKIDQLEKDVQDLYDRLTRVKVTFYDFVVYSAYKDKLMKSYDLAISTLFSKLQRTNDTEEKERIIERIVVIMDKQRKVEAMTDRLLLKVLSDLKAEEVEYPELGWWDIYGEHRSFDEVVKPYKPVDLRITDCYSEIGKSHVVRGGDIVIEGLVCGYGIASTEHVKAYLLDPESGKKEKSLASTEVGENLTTWNNVRIEWIAPAKFRLIINTRDLYSGMKIVRFEYGNDSVSVPFIVLEPYIKAEKIGNFLLIRTNIPAVVVKYNNVTQVYSVLNHKRYVYVGNVTTPITVQGYNTYSFVKVQVN